MPAAPDFDTLFDFETQFEALWKSVFDIALAERSLDFVETATARAIATKESPRIEIVFQTGPGIDQFGARRQATNPKQGQIAFQGNLSVTVVTGRAIAANNAGLHGRLRGMTRYLLTAGAKVATPINLPYLQIMLQTVAASSPQIYDEKQQDKTELVYAVQFAIQNGAWPQGV